MRTLIVLLIIAVLAYVAYEFFRVRSLVAESRELIEESRAYSRGSGDISMLVLGDSTAASVGSVPEFSVPGRLATLLNASVENHAKSGARTRDVLDQLRRASREHYDLILIQVGANDIVNLTPVARSEQYLEHVLKGARVRSDRVVLLTAGKVGDAPLLPSVMRPIFNIRTARLRERFMALSEKYGVEYVDIYSRESPFASDVPRYYAHDQFHLSGEGYGFWFGIVREYVEKKWPDLIKSDR